MFDKATPDQEIRTVQERIRSAFLSAAQPEDNNIAPHECEECDQIKSSFGGKKWMDLSQEVIAENYDKIPLFTPQAFHYFLPAFLIRSLEEFHPGSSILEFTLYSLSPTKTKPDDRWYSERLASFTKDQISAVVGFLKLILNDERFYMFHKDAERGLGKFWR